MSFYYRNSIYCHRLDSISTTFIALVVRRHLEHHSSSPSHHYHFHRLRTLNLLIVLLPSVSPHVGNRLQLDNDQLRYSLACAQLDVAIRAFNKEPDRYLRGLPFANCEHVACNVPILGGARGPMLKGIPDVHTLP